MLNIGRVLGVDRVEKCLSSLQIVAVLPAFILWRTVQVYIQVEAVVRVIRTSLQVLHVKVGRTTAEDMSQRVAKEALLG